MIIATAIPALFGLLMCLFNENSYNKLLGFYCCLSNTLIVMLCSFHEDLINVLDIMILGILMVMALSILLIKLW